MSAEWRDKFKSNVTRVAFQMKLSRPMMEMLCAASDDVAWDRAAFGGNIFQPDNWYITERALTQRGLLRRKKPQAVELQRGDRFPNFYELTPAGVAVVELMKVGGIFLKADAARLKMSARKGRN